ncbi:hypothetical protein C1645_780757 [Glomus cerebriforme]|uniref:Uncharacterized protein n=1 Tax=Glomus cerebriforme TaxID=658196 RepID=A0A397SI94_9GLOM|nr:hypothetical protein C1645_780757 [Glomus cerebriforme]
MAPGLFIVTGPISDDFIILVGFSLRHILYSFRYILSILLYKSIAVGLSFGSECQHSFINSI